MAGRLASPNSKVNIQNIFHGCYRTVYYYLIRKVNTQYTLWQHSAHTFGTKAHP